MEQHLDEAISYKILSLRRNEIKVYWYFLKMKISKWSKNKIEPEEKALK